VTLYGNQNSRFQPGSRCGTDGVEVSWFVGLPIDELVEARLRRH